MTERIVWQDPHRAEQVVVEDLSPHGWMALIVDQYGLSCSARLDRAAATRLRDTLNEWLHAQDSR